MDYLENLNKEQKEAVCYTDGPLLIFAGAGSGKTRVLTYRIAHLIENGADPYNIIAITFTNKAAKEMRQRVTNVTPLGGNVWVSTFHSACTRILRYEIEHTIYSGGFTIYDTQDTVRLLKECISDADLLENEYPANYVAGVISSLKNELTSPADFEKSARGNFRDRNIATVYHIYQSRLERANALDFDDIIFKTVELLRTNEEVRYKYQRRFQHVMVDEYQDTNGAQYELVKLLSGMYNNICVVGDDDQSIYGWRGANVRNILNFEQDFPGAKTVKLEQNYRSTQVILDGANSVISANTERASKRLWTENGRGQPITCYCATNERDEAAYIVKRILDTQNDLSLRDYAVLYRTNAQSRLLEDAFVMAGLPYRIYSGLRFYERMEIKDILAYLKVINNPADDISFQRIINVPRRGIGQVTINKFLKYAKDNETILYEALAQADNIPDIGKKTASIKNFINLIHEIADFSADNTVVKTLEMVLNVTGYMKFLDDGTDEGSDRKQNVEELLAKAQSFSKESEDPTLARFLEDVALVADIDNFEETAEAVSLMTLHSSKGLEFDTVFIAGMEEHMFPSLRGSKLSELEEERRLCYVGFTRAKRSLHLTHAYSRRKYADLMRNPRSRFIKAIQEDCIDFVNFSGRSTKPPAITKPKTLGDLATMSGKNTTPKTSLPTPKSTPPDYNIGDSVRQLKYGIGKVLDITPAGRDYEITVEFPGVGQKKFMSNFGGLKKIQQ